MLFMTKLNFSVAVSKICPYGWIQNPIKKTCLKLFLTKKIVEETRADSQLYNSSLAILDTDESRDWFIHLRQTANGKSQGAFRKKDINI